MTNGADISTECSDGYSSLATRPSAIHVQRCWRLRQMAQTPQTRRRRDVQRGPGNQRPSGRALSAGLLSRGHVRQGGGKSAVIEVAIGQAAWGGSWSRSGSLAGGVSSAMASSCMERCWSCYSSFCSRSTAPIRRTMAGSLGKIPTTSARRLTSLLSRSSGLVLCSLVRCWAGNVM